MRMALVGHVCVDKNVVRGETETLYGGGVVHGAITASRLGVEAVVLTRCAQADRIHYQHMTEAGAQVTFLPSSESTSIRNVYPTENPDDRQSFLISRAAPFAAPDLDHVMALEPDIVHVNPLWLGEFPPALLGLLRPHAAFLSADAQGFLRVPEPNGRMVYRDFADKRQLLPLLDLFKVDSKEALILTGEENPRQAARAVHALGARMVLLTHRDGACVFDGHTCHASPFTGFTLEGRTGRGDTCTASFLAARGRGRSLADALAFATEITSRKMQYRGPYRG
jgi:sugar/nucleoside kinase (ribokinase family)